MEVVISTRHFKDLRKAGKDALIRGGFVAVARRAASPAINPPLMTRSIPANNQLQRLLRRDQIWFTDKKPDGSARLYPLSDFRVRNDLSIPESYLDGRFGAVPILTDEDSLLLPDPLPG